MWSVWQTKWMFSQSILDTLESEMIVKRKWKYISTRNGSECWTKRLKMLSQWGLVRVQTLLIPALSPNFSFTKSFECNTKKGRQQTTKLEMKILPFPWTLKKALGRLKDVLPSQIHHCPPSNLTSVLLISQHSPDTHSPPKHSKKCNLKAYQRHPSLLV